MVIEDRFPSLISLSLATLGFGLSCASGFTCSFVQTKEAPLGIFCSSSSASVDLMTTLSKAFLASSWSTSIPCVMLSWILALFIPPTDGTLKALSVLSGLTSVLSIPGFLILESDVCKDAGGCAMSTGAFLLIMQAIANATVSALSALVSPPSSWEVKENWTVGQKGGFVHGAASAIADVVSGVFDKIQEKRDWRLRYVGTGSTGGDGEHGAMEPFGGDMDGEMNGLEDDDAMELAEDARALATLEQGEQEQIPLTISVRPNEQLPSQSPRLTEASTPLPEESNDPPGVILTAATMEEEEERSKPGNYDSSYGDTTDDEASRMAQLQTSHLDSDGVEAQVVYTERPPAYDLDTPDLIGEDFRSELSKKEDQQYWADENALAPPSDAENNRLVDDSSSNDDNSSENEAQKYKEDAAAKTVSAGAIGFSNSKKLRKRGRDLKKSIRTLGGKRRAEAAYIAMDHDRDLSGGKLALEPSTTDCVYDDNGERRFSNGQEDEKSCADVRSVSFIRVDSTTPSLVQNDADESLSRASESESITTDLSTLIAEVLPITTSQDPSFPPPPPPPLEDSKCEYSKKEEYEDPPVAYYPSSSEAEESDLDITETLEDMPEDELEAYTSDGGSSFTSGQSLSSYTLASGNEADDSSLSSFGGSEDESDLNISSLVAEVLGSRKEEKKKKVKEGKSRDPQGRRRRRKKKKRRGKRRAKYHSANSSIGSRSLLDETIEEETDIDLEQEISSEGNITNDNNDHLGVGGDPEEAVTDLVAGSRIDKDDILNTIIETSMAIDPPECDVEESVYESGYLSRSPAASDSEKSFSALCRVVTPSPGKAPSYRTLVEPDAAYHSAPETKLERLDPSPAAILHNKVGVERDYMSDANNSARAFRGLEPGVNKPTRRPHQMTTLVRNDARYENITDDSSVQGSVASARHHYEMPTSWKAEKTLRSPLQYFSDSSSNTDSSNGGFSARTSASRQARKARKRRLSLQQGGAVSATYRIRSHSVDASTISRGANSTATTSAASIAGGASNSTTCSRSSNITSPTKEKTPASIYESSGGNDTFKEDAFEKHDVLEELIGSISTL